MRPLVLNTRSKNQAREFSVLLDEAGFDTVEIPALEIHFLDSVGRVITELQILSPEDIVAFTSANAAAIVEQSARIKELLGQVKIAVIGNKTASTIRQNGLTVHFQSAQASSADLALLIASKQPKKVLYLSGVPNTGTLSKILSKANDFVEVPVYSSKPSTTLKTDLIEFKSEVEKAEYVTFLSKESLNAFHDVAMSLGLEFKEKKCVVISPGVADAAKILGYEQIAVSQARSIEAVVSEIVSLSSVTG